jgi:hypothetical protein
VVRKHELSADVEAVAEVLAAELEFSCPTALDGEDGWYAVAERTLAAVDQNRPHRTGCRRVSGGQGQP